MVFLKLSSSKANSLGIKKIEVFLQSNTTTHPKPHTLINSKKHVQIECNAMYVEENETSFCNAKNMHTKILTP